MSTGAAYALMWAGFIAYLGALAAAPRLGGRPASRRLAWGAIVLLVVGLGAAPVLLSHDAYSYVDYARLGVVHGLDPYVHPPAAAPADPAYAEVEWTEATSAYGPLFTLLAYPLAWLPVGAAVGALKALAAASVLGIAALVARLAPARGIEPLRAAAFVALNPLVLVHVVGGAHNDGLAMLLAMLGVAALLTACEAAGGAAFVAAIAIKASTAVLAPFALVATLKSPPRGLSRPPFGRSRPVSRASTAVVAPFALLGAAQANRHAEPPPDRRAAWSPLSRKATLSMGRKMALSPVSRNAAHVSTIGPVGRLALGAALALVAIAVAAYAAFGWDWLGAIGLAGENQSRTSYMSVPIAVARLTGLDPTAVRVGALVLYAALVIHLFAWAWRGNDWLRAAAWASFGLLLATSWLLPWYLIWALPLAALSRDRPLQLLLLALTAYQLGARIPL